MRTDSFGLVHKPVSMTLEGGFILWRGLVTFKVTCQICVSISSASYKVSSFRHFHDFWFSALLSKQNKAWCVPLCGHFFLKVFIKVLWNEKDEKVIFMLVLLVLVRSMFVCAVHNAQRKCVGCTVDPKVTLHRCSTSENSTLLPF